MSDEVTCPNCNGMGLLYAGEGWEPGPSGFRLVKTYCICHLCSGKHLVDSAPFQREDAAQIEALERRVAALEVRLMATMQERPVP